MLAALTVTSALAQKRPLDLKKIEGDYKDPFPQRDVRRRTLHV
jgi:hypothetical protein